jgi:hypothetical protein
MCTSADSLGPKLWATRTSLFGMEGRGVHSHPFGGNAVSTFP